MEPYRLTKVITGDVQFGLHITKIPYEKIKKDDSKAYLIFRNMKNAEALKLMINETIMNFIMLLEPTNNPSVEYINLDGTDPSKTVGINLKKLNSKNTLLRTESYLILVTDESGDYSLIRDGALMTLSSPTCKLEFEFAETEVLRKAKIIQ